MKKLYILGFLGALTIINGLSASIYIENTAEIPVTVIHHGLLKGDSDPITLGAGDNYCLKKRNGTLLDTMILKYNELTTIDQPDNELTIDQPVHMSSFDTVIIYWDQDAEQIKIETKQENRNEMCQLPI